jgi:hypothetical protein
VGIIIVDEYIGGQYLMWMPESKSEFLLAISEGLSNLELADRFDTTMGRVDHFIRFLRQNDEMITPRPRSKQANPVTCVTDDTPELTAKDKTNFILFLKKARLTNEISAKFGNKSEALLDEEYPSYNLFEQVDGWGRERYILLPEVKTEELKLAERNWSFYNSPSRYGDFFQPYQLVQLPDDMFDNTEECVYITPLYDVHFGHCGHKHEKFSKYLKWIEETPNLLTFFGGDLEENALDDGRGMTYDQDIPPTSQIDELCKLLAPIAHKVLFMLPGNHEKRTMTKAGIDPSEVIAKYLNIPYFSGPVYCSILGCGNKWKLYARHGTGAGTSKAGMMSSLNKVSGFTDFMNFIVQGHSHNSSCNTQACIVENPIECCLEYKTQWSIVCPSFLRWEETYAYKAEMPPPSNGGILIKLYADGNYDASFKDKG